MSLVDEMGPAELAGLKRARDSLAVFAANLLQVRDKSGRMYPLRFSPAQKLVDERLDAQRRKTGKVRAVIVKSRQQGASTYVQARFFHRLWTSPDPLRAFILTHDEQASANLFAMTQTFHAMLPAPLRPQTSVASAKEMMFPGGAGYKVATAGSKATGRSSTIQLFHGSEVAYWPNDAEHVAGALQAVGDAAGTEVILESTANGVGNIFHRYATAAMRGESDYQVIFLPWSLAPEYAMDCPKDWTCSAAWMDYGHSHSLTWSQLRWAWRKNEEFALAIGASLDEPCWKFRQEYPADFNEAFQTSSDAFIRGVAVLRARRAEPQVIPSGPIVLGIDSSRLRDKVGVIDRRGRRMGSLVCERMEPGGNGVFVAQQLAAIIDRIKPRMVNIDVGAEGTIYDLLLEYCPGVLINPVNFGSAPVGKGPTGDRNYANRRAEMWDAMREWFSQELPVQVPDDDAFQEELTSLQWGPSATRYSGVNGQLLLESKDQVKARLKHSPDLADAAALTFATPAEWVGDVAFQTAPRERAKRRTGY